MDINVFHVLEYRLPDNYSVQVSLGQNSIVEMKLFNNLGRQISRIQCLQFNIEKPELVAENLQQYKAKDLVPVKRYFLVQVADSSRPSLSFTVDRVLDKGNAVIISYSAYGNQHSVSRNRRFSNKQGIESDCIFIYKTIFNIE